MEQNKETIRDVLQYYYDKCKNASQAANKLCAAYGPDTVSISTAQRWCQRFRFGVEVVEDAPRSGRPGESLLNRNQIDPNSFWSV